MDLIRMLCTDGMGEATSKLFIMLFTLLNQFVKSSDYNAQKRHLLKLFLEHLKPCIFHVTGFREH